MSLQQVLESEDDPALSSAVNDLGMALFARNNEANQWSGKKFSRILSKIPKTYPASASRHQYPPDLNPTATDAPLTAAYRINHELEAKPAGCGETNSLELNGRP